MTPTDSTITYELIVSRTSKEWDPHPEYEVMIYRMITAGVCGPFSETATVKGMANVMILLDSWGFEQTGPPELTTTVEAFAEAVFPVAPKR